jgi:hypothetical protein
MLSFILYLTTLFNDLGYIASNEGVISMLKKAALTEF